jgi:hypothetical protein
MIGQRARESREFPRARATKREERMGMLYHHATHATPQHCNTATYTTATHICTYTAIPPGGWLGRHRENGNHGKGTAVGTCLTLPPRISQPAGHPKPSRPVPRDARLSTPPPQPAGRVLLVRYCEACTVCRMYVPRATANGVAAWA